MGPSIESFLPPVVIISACGLLCLAQFARYTALVGRVREFHRQRLEGLERLDALAGSARALMAERCDELEHQAHEVLKLVRLIRDALLCLVGSVICMILSSLLTGLQMLLPSMGSQAAMTAFVMGLVIMLVGMIYVFQEARLSLRVVMAEHERMERIMLSSSQGRDSAGDSAEPSAPRR